MIVLAILVTLWEALQLLSISLLFLCHLINDSLFLCALSFLDSCLVSQTLYDALFGGWNFWCRWVNWDISSTVDYFRSYWLASRQKIGTSCCLFLFMCSFWGSWRLVADIFICRILALCLVMLVLNLIRWLLGVCKLIVKRLVWVVSTSKLFSVD